MPGATKSGEFSRLRPQRSQANTAGQARGRPKPSTSAFSTGRRRVKPILFDRICELWTKREYVEELHPITASVRQLATEIFL
jgi:hypothetical protein